MKSGRFVDPLADFGSELYSIQKPARYLGGEVGSHPPIDPSDERLRFALCFPDLYEIGMSNNAIRILYNDLGLFSGEMVCERTFAPGPDFEALLKRLGLPLYTLESGIPLHSCDILGFSIGYELLATNILAVLETGMIPLRTKDRGETDPVVIAGGPAATNPHPFGAFLDAVYIGEAEAEFYSLIREIAAIKRTGGGRRDILARLDVSKSIWMSPESQAINSGGRKPKIAYRAVYSGFSYSTANTSYPIPVLQTVQNHGTVEIMRGCPNGCRFCHAGYFYRPQRVKSRDRIEAEIASLVEKGGYREITLASLSSGDYPDIVGLFKRLNGEWKDRFVSFQLPSLKVDTFTLPLLAELSEVRKSGLTFAVETPVESWQASINKVVSFDKIADIIKEAKRFGFRSAKFYFMIGLPLPGRGKGEGEAIVDFLTRISQAERMAFNVNIGIFVPKPHTPYAREAQIGETEALDTIYFIKDALKPFKFISISYHSPFTSVLEGILSRGDEGVGDIILAAYSKGARLDAWDEHFRKDVWKSVFAEIQKGTGRDPSIEYLSARDDEAALPWDDINLFVSGHYLAEEKTKSESSEMTSACGEDCAHRCGSCNEHFRIVSNTIHDNVTGSENPSISQYDQLFSVGDAFLSPGDNLRFIISFKKKENAVFYPLHSISGIFSRAFLVLGLPIRYTEGFNPLPKMEFTQPLALGVESEDDIAAVWLIRGLKILDKDRFIATFNKELPKGMLINDIRQGKKRSDGKNSIGSLYIGSLYTISFKNLEDSRLAAKTFSGSNMLLDMVFDEERKSISLFANDAHGGDGNVVKLLINMFGCEKNLDRCSIRRERSYAVSSSGERINLFESL